jgi:hypothetical protein
LSLQTLPACGLEMPALARLQQGSIQIFFLPLKITLDEFGVL